MFLRRGFSFLLDLVAGRVSLGGGRDPELFLKWGGGDSAPFPRRIGVRAFKTREKEEDICGN